MDPHLEDLLWPGGPSLLRLRGRRASRAVGRPDRVGGAARQVVGAARRVGGAGRQVGRAGGLGDAACLAVNRFTSRTVGLVTKSSTKYLTCFTNYIVKVYITSAF